MSGQTASRHCLRSLLPRVLIVEARCETSYTDYTGDGGMTTKFPSVVLLSREDPKDAAALQSSERTPASGLAGAAGRGPALCRPRKR